MLLLYYLPKKHSIIICDKKGELEMKRIMTLLLLFVFGLVALKGNVVHATEIIKEYDGEPIVVFGETLSDVERDKVRELVDVGDEKVHELDVTGADYAKYVNGNPGANMYSSVKITHEKEGHGIVVHIVTPENITLVTNEMYANALITAGVENAKVDVASPRQVTGESALTGIYKAFDASGEGLDDGRMEVANEEINLTTDLAKKEGLSQEKVTELMTEIKKAISEKNPATREDIEEIIKEQLDKLEVNLSDADIQLLIDLFEKMKNLNIDFDQVKEQLNDITSTIKDKLDDLNIDQGFFEKVAEFFKNLFDTIASWFK